MATKKHPHAAKTQAADTGEEGWVTDDPKLGEEYYLLDNGIPMTIPDVTRTFHPMELSVNPAVAIQTPSYLIDDTQPLSVSPRSTPLLMLPDLPQEERVEAYHAASDAHAETLQAQIDQAQAGLDAMSEIQDPPEPPEPPEPEPQPEFLTLPAAAVEAQKEEETRDPKGETKSQSKKTGDKDPVEKTDEALAEEREARDESEPGFPPPDDKKE